MAESRCFICGDFWLDADSEQLHAGSRTIDLSPKAWGVLRHLLERPGRLVTKGELLDAVWGEVTVGEGSLTKVIFELRSAFDDDAQKPRFIETVHRRGFRFIAPLAIAEPPAGFGDETNDVPFIGREAELQQLQRWQGLALSGQRQIVFITGEAGIGKTALVDAFLAALQCGGVRVWAAVGQCIEQYGPREAFMPVLEALGRLCRQSGGERLVDLLRRHAPNWLSEIPGVLTVEDRDALQRSTLAVTPERMLRVMVDALEVISADAPVVLVLEDIHWSDYSTLDLLSAVAQRREPARLLIVATYRPVDAIMQRHPVQDVRQTLQLHGRCRSLAVELLSPAQVDEYLRRRFDKSAFPATLADLLHRHTDGNPLFLMAVIDYLQAQGRIESTDGVWQLAAPIESIAPGVPETLRLMIERQYESLDADQRLAVDAASVAGHTVAVPVLAAALELDLGATGAICEPLARRGLFLRQIGSCAWPDGTSAVQYRFIHSLYERALYDHVAAEQRRTWHRRIGERIEAGHRNSTAEVAAELAVHFEQARVPEKSLYYLEQAASNAARRFADQEAIGYLNRALESIALLPESPERTQHEVSLLMTLGGLQLTTLGYGADVARETYARILSLCREHEEQPQILPALGGLALYHLNKGELARAQELGEQMLAAGERMQLPGAVLAYMRAPLALALFYRGRFNAAAACVEQGLALCDPTDYPRGAHVWSDQGVSALGHLAIALSLRGYPEQARARSGQALERAHALGLAGSLAHANCFAAVLHYFLREWQQVEELGRCAVQVAEENGLRFWHSQGLTICGAGLAQLGRVDEGVELLRKGYADTRAAGGIATGTYVHCMTAEAFICDGRFDEAETELAEAFALSEETDECFAEAELYRNRGTILLQRLEKTAPIGRRSGAKRRRHDDDREQAATWFEKAIDVARAQGAVWWELRAVVDLCRLWHGEGRSRQARDRLGEFCARFTEGFDTPDLRAAAALLKQLG